MTPAEMTTFVYDQIDHARIGLELPSLNDEVIGRHD